MNLDDPQIYSRFDPQNLLTQIDGLPDQLEAAWTLGSTLSLGGSLPQGAAPDVRQVVLTGVGSSGDGLDLLAAYLAPACSVPLVVQREEDLPAWAAGPHTLVIACSHSGSDEETLSVFERAHASGCRRLAVATGGALSQAASQQGAALWTYNHNGPACTAVAFAFGLPLAALARLGLVPDPSNEVIRAAAALRQRREHLKVDTPVARNPAKRMAGQLVGRWVVVFGADFLAPVARRWKSQLNRLARAWVQVEVLPEAAHSTLAGTQNPEAQVGQVMALFLRATSIGARSLQRSDLTRQVLMLEGMNTDFADAFGETPLAQQWTAVQFGDYMAYYLAMAYGVDPAEAGQVE